MVVWTTTLNHPPPKKDILGRMIISQKSHKECWIVCHQLRFCTLTATATYTFISSTLLVLAPKSFPQPPVVPSLLSPIRQNSRSRRSQRHAVASCDDSCQGSVADSVAAHALRGVSDVRRTVSPERRSPRCTSAKTGPPNEAGPVLVQLSEGESSTSEETAESTGEAEILG